MTVVPPFLPQDPSEYISRFTTESAAMSLIETQPLDAAVPTCGDWDLAALATHVGGCTDGPPLLRTAAMPERGAVSRPDSPDERTTGLPTTDALDALRG